MTEWKIDWTDEYGCEHSYTAATEEEARIIAGKPVKQNPLQSVHITSPGGEITLVVMSYAGMDRWEIIYRTKNERRIL